VVDLKPLIEAGGVFEKLRDIDAFKAFSIDPEWHVLSWDNGRIDVAPETIYEEATGEPAHRTASSEAGKKVLPRVAEEHARYGDEPQGEPRETE